MRPFKSWTRAAIESVRDDEEYSDSSDDENLPVPQDYLCDLESMPESVQRAFVQLHSDEDTEKFISECQTWTKENAGRWYDFMSFFFRMFCSMTTSNGILRIGHMFVLSTAHIQTLLGPDVSGTLLDVGSGDGNVTQQFAPMFKDIVCTEVSSVMAAELRRKKFRCVETYEITEEALLKGLQNEGGVQPTSPLQFNVISCLNVLDRCSKPRTLLKQMAALLTPKTGLLLLAIVLPFEPFVETSVSWTQMDPEEDLIRYYKHWEVSVQHLIKDVFEPLGLKLKALSRVPYLCCGMTKKEPVVYLDDAIFVLYKDDIQPEDEGMGREKGKEKEIQETEEETSNEEENNNNKKGTTEV